MIDVVKDLKIVHEINKHATLYLSARIKDGYTDNYVKEVNAEKEILVYAAEDFDILFTGIIQQIEIHASQNVYYLEIHGISNSFITDTQKVSRSFQDKDMTYKDMIQKIIGNYPGGDILDKTSNGKTIEKFIMQYNETDWEFFKRMASHFNQGLLATLEYEKPKIYFGIPEGDGRGTLDQFNYYVSKDIGWFMKSSQNDNPQLQELDTVEFNVQCGDHFKIGDSVTYHDINLYIKSLTINLLNGLLMFGYTLSTKNGLSQDKLYNEQIIGLSLKGVVLKAIADTLKVHLEIDESQDEAKAWKFPYTTMYTAEGNSGWYCMPEVDDTVFIYFPTKQEDAGVGMNSIRELNKTTDKITDPRIKYFRTIDGKELKFSPDEILITCINGKDPSTGELKKTHIRLNQDAGIEIVSTEPIILKTNKEISMEAEKLIKFLAGEQIILKCKTSQIRIDTMIDICGREVRIN